MGDNLPTVNLEQIKQQNKSRLLIALRVLFSTISSVGVNNNGALEFIVIIVGKWTERDEIIYRSLI